MQWPISIFNMETANKKTKGVMYYHAPNVDAIRVLKHLRNVNVEKGSRIKLQLFLDLDFDRVFWYKNTEIIKEQRRIVIQTQKQKNKRMASLEVLRADITDTGTYFVVVETKHGIVSSFADVNVVQRNTLRKDPISIISELPTELDIFENQNLRLICKVKIDSNTSINWLKNGEDIDCNKFIMEDYGYGYIGLRKTSVATTDSGDYSLILRDEFTKTKKTCMCDVYIAPIDSKLATNVIVNRPLLSAVACLGSDVIFHCTFAITNCPYYHVVWYVGHYKIERSNSKFSVIWKGGEYILYIKKLEADMTGKVVCELRQTSYQKTVYVVGSSTAYLTVVPANYEGEECIKKIHKSKNSAAIKSQMISEGRDCNPIDISYCRLNEESSAFLKGFQGNIDVSTSVSCTERNGTFKIQWNQLEFPSCWFIISIGQSDGSYIEAGESSIPEVTTRIPPVGTLLKIRVICMPIENIGWESTLSIEPVQNGALKPPKNEIRSMVEYEEDYAKTGVVLGSGAFGKVVLARSKDGKHYAVKLIQSKGTQRNKVRARHEYDILKKVQHPKIIELVEGFEDAKVFAIVMEFIWGGDLLERIIDEEHIMEEDVIHYVRQICEALSFLHRLNIVHLDIKPENIVCLNPNSRQVKIIDFGLAKSLEDRLERTLYGTRQYMAPEIWNYDFMASVSDMWSVGVVSYILLSGRLPFEAESDSGIITKIMTASYDYNDEAFNDISDLAKNFVNKLLTVDTKSRMSAEEALKHDWLKTGTPEGAATCMKRTRENMKSYLASTRAKWKRAGRVMIAAHRLRLCTGSNIKEAQSSDSFATNEEPYEDPTNTKKGCPIIGCPTL